jgi:hypothetical protein
MVAVLGAALLGMVCLAMFGFESEGDASMHDLMREIEGAEQGLLRELTRANDEAEGLSSLFSGGGGVGSKLPYVAAGVAVPHAVSKRPAVAIAALPSRVVAAARRPPPPQSSASSSTTVSHVPGMSKLLDVVQHVCGPASELKGRTVMIAILDGGFVEMFFNFYRSCVLKYKMACFVPCAMDKAAYDALTKEGVPTAQRYIAKEHQGKASHYGDKSFKVKDKMKLNIISELLESGRNAMVTDVDITYFADPLTFINSPAGLKGADLQFQYDGMKGLDNAGLFFVRNTPAMQAYFKKAIEVGKGHKDWDAQGVLNHHPDKKKIKRGTLPHDEFQCGKCFFEGPVRRFTLKEADAKPCPNCLSVHHNWIVGTDAKIYRMKEFLMWYIDTNGYFTSPTAKYLTYSAKGCSSAVDESEAMKVALTLAVATGRILILPDFGCHKCHVFGWGADEKSCFKGGKRCPFNALFSVAKLNEQWPRQYRTSAFLRHPLVPAATKEPSATMRVCSSGIGCDGVFDGSSLAAITSSFVPVASAAVVHVDGIDGHSRPSSTLGSWKVSESDSVANAAHKRKLDNTFRRSTYRNYDDKMEWGAIAQHHW